MSPIAVYIFAMLIAIGGVIELARRAARKARVMNGGRP
jgi:hypothetical protein